MGLRSKSKTRLIILTAACAGVVALAGGFYGYRKMERNRVILASKPKGIEAFGKGEWVESRNLLQNYLSYHDDDLEALKCYVKVQAKLPEPGQADKSKLMTAYRRIVAQDRAMDYKLELLRLYLGVQPQMNTELLSGSDEIIRLIVADFVDASAMAAPAQAGTAPATGRSSGTSIAALMRAIAAIKAKVAASDPDVQKKYVEPLAEVLELRVLSATNLGRSHDELAGYSDAMVALRPDARAISVKLNAMRASGEPRDVVLAKMAQLTGWKKGDSMTGLKDEPMVTLMAGNYHFYGDDETAIQLANLATKLDPPVERDGITLAALLDRLERPEMFGLARQVIDKSLAKFNSEKAEQNDDYRKLLDESYRRLIYQRQYEAAATAIGKTDATRHALPLALRVVALCEWSKELAAAGNKAEADKKNEEALGVLKALKVCGERWDTLAIGWNEVLNLVYFPEKGKPQDHAVIDACENAILCDPGNPFFFEYQGDAYRSTGDDVAALQHWNAAAVRAPAWDRPLARTSRFYANNGDPGQTLDLARKANDRLPNQKETLIAIGISWKKVIDRMPPDLAARKKQATDLMAFLQKERSFVGNDENILAVEVTLLQELQGVPVAENRVREIIAATTKDDAQVLLAMMAVVGTPRMGMNPALIAQAEEAYQKLCGMTAELASAKCQLQLDATMRNIQKIQDPDASKIAALKKEASLKAIVEIKTLYQGLRKQAGDLVPAEKQKWDVNWCQLLEYFGDPSAHDEWKSVVTVYRDSSPALWAAFKSPSVHRDRLLTGQILSQLEFLNGNSGLQWRLAKGEWLLDDQTSRDSLEQAAKLLSQAVAASPDSVEARKLFAKGFELTGNINQSINELVRAAEIAPEDLEIKLTLGRLYIRQNDTPRAIDQLSRVLSALPPPEPNESESIKDMRLRAGGMLARSGDAGKALQVLLTVQGNSPALSQMKAPLYWRLGKLKEATEAYQALMKEKPTGEMIEQALPFFAAMGLDKDAADAIEKLDKLPEDANDPAHVSAGHKHAVKGSYLASTQKWDEAVRELDASVKADPKNGEYWRRFIATLIMAGRPGDGIKVAGDSAAALPGDPACAAIAKFSATPAQLTEPDLQAYMVACVMSSTQAKGVTDVVQILQANGIAAPTVARKLRSVADRNTESAALQIFAVRKLTDVNLLSEAVSVAQRAMLNDPDSAEPALLATKCLALAGRWEEALAAAQKWKTLSNGSPQADIVIAQCDINLDQAPEAVRLMAPYMNAMDPADPNKKAIDPTDSKNHEVVMLYATALMRSGRAGDAETLVWPSVQKDPNWREDWTKLASDHMTDRKKDLSAAIKWIDKLGAITAADDVSGQSILAMGWFRLGKNFEYKDAIFKGEQIAQKVTDAGAGDPAARGVAAMLFGNLRDQQGDYKAAETYYRKALDLNKDLFFAANNLAMVLVKEGGDANLKEAEAFAKKSIDGIPAGSKMAPLKVPFYDTLATVLSSEKKYDEALSTIQMAIDADPENPLWWLNKAEIHVASGRPDKARDAIGQLTRLNVDPKKWPSDLKRRYDDVDAAIKKL